MDDEDSQVLIIVDDIEYHNYLEGYPSPEKISKDEMEYFNKVLSKHLWKYRKEMKSYLNTTIKNYFFVEQY